MKSFGNIDLQNNFLLNPVLKEVENYPASPKVGQFIFKNKRVMICVEIASGLPIWAPLTVVLNTHIHEQTTAATTWTIPHGLNASAVMAQIVDVDGKHVIPDEIQCTYNQVVVTFYSAMTGRAVLMLGNDDGLARVNPSFEASFENLSVWVVNHILGYNPLVRVFVGMQEVQPASIVHNSLNQLTVTFSTPQSGQVRCI
jgi:hypothetical protein